GALSGARSLHSTDEAEEHAAVPQGRGADHAPGARILRLSGEGLYLKGSFTQPVLIGALVSGVLSALPIVQAGNICCCLWIILGGVAAAFVLQQRQPTP